MKIIHESRRCWKCGETKPLDLFYNMANDPLGKQRQCIACAKARNKVYAAEHREYFAKKGREHYDKADNKARYQRYRSGYLARRDAELRSVDGRLYAIWHAAKDRARRRGLEFTITRDWLLERYEAQHGKCLLTGLALNFERANRRYTPFGPSLDRRDCGVGYTPDNTRLVCTAVNIAMNTFGEETFARVCEGFLRTRDLSN